MTNPVTQEDIEERSNIAALNAFFDQGYAGRLGDMVHDLTVDCEDGDAEVLTIALKLLRQGRDRIQSTKAAMKERDDALAEVRKALKDALEALRAAEQFIDNGIEFGYIQMPDPDTPDRAHQVPGMVTIAVGSVTDAKAQIDTLLTPQAQTIAGRDGE